MRDKTTGGRRKPGADGGEWELPVSQVARNIPVNMPGARAGWGTFRDLRHTGKMVRSSREYRNV
jgi:hypothetical protein